MSDPSPAEVVFFAALDKAAPARAAYLDAACAGNERLRRRVEALLAAHSQVGQFLERPVAEAEGVAGLGDDGTAAADLTFLAPPTEPDSLGRLDHYEVLEVVGRGGTGVVLRAHDTKLRRVVALKVLTASLAASGTARQRFAREARAAACVRDDHVVAIHAVRDDAPLPYLVMEYIDGSNLEALLRKGGPLGVKEVLRIGIQVASGLAAAHKQGLIHRDVKPANILLENGVQRVKITDFGLARAADDASLTQTGLIAGTPLYMAPEQAACEPIDHRADLFSLGSVLYEMCTGRPAFRAPTTVAVIRRVCDDTPRPVREVNPDIPEPLCQLIARLHAKRPADRPASAAEVADLLAGMLADPRGHAPRRRPVGRARVWAGVALLLLAGVGLEAGGVTDVRGAVSGLLAPATRPTAEEWERAVALLPADEQVAAVVRRLRELNPGFDGRVEHRIKDGVVRGLVFRTDEVADLSPVRALRGLEGLDCPGSFPRRGKLADLTPLRGLRLTHLNCSSTQVADLGPLRGMPLTELIAGETRVRDVSPLQGMGLRVIALQRTEVADLAPLRGMPLTYLDLYGAEHVSDLKPLAGLPLRYLNLSRLWVTDLAAVASLTSLDDLNLHSLPVADLTPLRGLRLTVLNLRGTRATDLTPVEGMPLERLDLDYRPEHEGFVRSFPRLKHINQRPAAEFWEEVSRK